ncbi:Na+/H+ antiporter NhaC [Pleomorphovibrio marinus]|uniref:Na+/H+ antiporter NhaC n=1 Tax=Pleomorphovibrio marinus TaxID=2164132 RepID=UPI000E0B0CBB|nr:Na+/H+ antiporter NhaC [Pleomorphovibrio marinus]
MAEQRKDCGTPPPWLALIPLVITGASLGFSVFVFEVEPHFSLFLGAVVAGFCGYWWGYSWKDIEEGFTYPISRTVPSVIILLIIGMLMAVWIASGIVPALMYYGFKFFVAKWFLPLILLFCCVMALVTGSSWSTIGTLGVAAIGVSEGLGVPTAISAGAVVSGSFFGDKLSPMSDSTNLTPSVLGVGLYPHIKHMLYTTLPSLGICLAAFTLVGLFIPGSDSSADTGEYAEHIQEHFDLSMVMFLPPLIVIFLIIKKVPAIPSLSIGVVLGSIGYLVFQGGNTATLVETLHSGFVMETGKDEMDSLFSTGGMESMYNVINLALISLAFGGIMNKTGMLKSVLQTMSRFVSSTGNLTVTVLGTAVFVNIFGANQYLAVILPGQMFEETYRRRKLKLKNLSRTLEAGGTLTAPLIPWNSNAIFVYSTLGVSAANYFPYAFLCWFTAILVAIYGYAGITMEEDKDGYQKTEDKP